jgi:uncharacterized membrane protein
MSLDTQLVIGPNASLSERQAWFVMAALCAVGFGIAGVFAALGFWPVLPFAGLELAAVGAALWVCLRRNRYREVLVFRGDTLRIEFGLLGQGAVTAIELPRAWTRAQVEPGELPSAPTRLLLCCSGQRVEVGRVLTDAERGRLVRRIRQLLQPGWVSGSAARTLDQAV